VKASEGTIKTDNLNIVHSDATRDNLDFLPLKNQAKNDCCTNFLDNARSIFLSVSLFYHW
jgi:hypothetical protein